MAAQRPIYSIGTFQSSCLNTDTQMNVHVSNKRFKIDIFTANFRRSPALLSEYLRQVRRQEPEFVPGMDDLGGDPLEEMHEWILQPFLPIFRKLAPLDQGRKYTLEDFLYAEEFHYTVEVVEETLVPVYLGHSKRTKLLFFGACLPSITYFDYSMFPVYHPSEIQVSIDADSTSLPGFPQKVFIHGRSKPSFLKIIFAGGARVALKELMAYSKIYIANFDATVLTSRLDGLVHDGEGNTIGFLLSYINGPGSTLEFNGGHHPKYSESRQKWFHQISHTLQQLHAHNIVWGDAKPANVLLDPNGDAYIIDFGGGYTPGCVEKEMAGTIAGDLQGLESIRQYLFE
ncbi:hypothetical protein ANOM_010747 [Aspergillus nomiae NRRL 13137]|uniref:Protein kinase domain-containing protein n=1 Tax=Aspergillus nomiae NRRL (strain ATCC 15546 / NRRL 13137 / CBS 260.88 / M93) TaxID=1509407 RepID=A0A0L1IQE8_ASPN3|nr:uncharacterized protein ANOM_010747 [Aspergillus nomiae NRRL 13137]KNG81816.1 hypothetical protein ANOM_010747 [Aspergillus nomiae NRRL 13137]